jgi:hypothetical protein
MSSTSVVTHWGGTGLQESDNVSLLITQAEPMPNVACVPTQECLGTPTADYLTTCGT